MSNLRYVTEHKSSCTSIIPTWEGKKKIMAKFQDAVIPHRQTSQWISNKLIQTGLLLDKRNEVKCCALTNRNWITLMLHLHILLRNHSYALHRTLGLSHQHKLPQSSWTKTIEDNIRMEALGMHAWTAFLSSAVIWVNFICYVFRLCVYQFCQQSKHAGQIDGRSTWLFHLKGSTICGSTQKILLYYSRICFRRLNETMINLSQGSLSLN